jgi:hypothetical protein
MNGFRQPALGEGIAVLKFNPCERARSTIAWDDVQVNVGVLVHQERIVKMVGLKAGRKHCFEFSDDGP